MATLSGTGVLGYVGYWYSPYTGRIVQVEDIVHLHESVCMGLKVFGEATAKPTRCATMQNVSKTVYDTVQVKKKVFYWTWVKTKNGKKRVRKSKYVTVTKQVPRTVTEQVPGPSVPCYGSGQTLPEWYRAFAVSLHVLAHESVHVFDFYVGARVQTKASSESRAECFGMQFIYPVAMAFGADPDDGRALAKWYYENEYPRWEGTNYWRPDCVANGPLDITPNDPIFPRRAGGSLSSQDAVYAQVTYER